jgi:arsenate reductase (glutaredoxin)
VSPIKVYGIANCDTVKKARQWLDANQLPHQFHDFKKLGIPQEELQTWLSACGWETLLNRRGTTWRQLDAAAQAAVTDAASAAALMQAQPSVIKRPVVRWGEHGISVGFDPDAWSARASRPPG